MDRQAGHARSQVWIDCPIGVDKNFYNTRGYGLFLLGISNINNDHTTVAKDMHSSHLIF